MSSLKDPADMLLDELPGEIIAKIVCKLGWSELDRINLSMVNRSLNKSAYEWPDDEALWVTDPTTVGRLIQYDRFIKVKELRIADMCLVRLELERFDEMIRFLGKTVIDLEITNITWDISYITALLRLPKLRKLKVDFQYLWNVNLLLTAIEDLELNLYEVDGAFRQFCENGMPPGLQKLQLNILEPLIDVERCSFNTAHRLDYLPRSLNKLGIQLGPNNGCTVSLLTKCFVDFPNLAELSISVCMECCKFPRFVKTLDEFVKERLSAATKVLRLTHVPCKRPSFDFFRGRLGKENGQAESKEFTGPFEINLQNFLKSTAGIAMHRRNPLRIEIHHGRKTEREMELDVNGKLHFTMRYWEQDYCTFVGMRYHDQLTYKSG